VRAIKPTIVAAHPLELEGISGGIPLGVGLIEAALGISEVLAQKPEAIVLVGSCGAYPGTDLAIGDVVLADEAVLVTEGDLPDIVPIRSRPPLFEMALRHVRVATTTGITVDDARAAAIAKRTGASIENLEAFAVARGCERANIPLAMILGVTNTVGSKGRAEWRANAKRIATAIATLISEIPPDGARGKER
jgi:futalosine hydrolase